jgi:outer membrane protein assembly factor BamE (lipoprotein component of BamABCDE complex)
MRRNILIRKRSAWILTLVSFLFGCASTYVKGSRIDEVAVKKIEIGKTNRSDVLRMFGAPGQDY